MSEPGKIVQRYVNLSGAEPIHLNYLLGHNSPSHQDNVDATELRKRILIENNRYRGGSVSVPFNEWVGEQNIEDALVKLKDIYSTQSWVRPSVVKGYLSGVGKDQYPVIGFRVKGTDKVVLVNGNHRVAAAAIRGGKRIRMKVIDAPENYFKDLKE